MLDNEKGASFGTIVSFIGAVLLALGVVWLVAWNWHEIPPFLRVIILLVATSAAFSAGVFLRVKDYAKIGESLIFLGSILFTLSIFLISQMYLSNITHQGYAWLWLLSFAGVLAAALLFKSEATMLVASIEFVVWATVQAMAFSHFSFITILFEITAWIIALGNLSAIKGKNKDGLNVSLSLLGPFLIYLVTLAFFDSLKFQGVCNVILLSLVALVVAAYLLKSRISLLLSMFLFFLWANVQVSELMHFSSSSFIPAVFALLYLIIAVLFYGLNLLHRYFKHDFSSVYGGWTLFYLLLFAFILSFQALLPQLWPSSASLSESILLFLVIGALVSVATFIAGAVLSIESKTTDLREVFGVALIVIFLGALILAASLVSNSLGTSHNYFSYFGDSAPFNLWLVWIFANIILVGVILAVIGYGTLYSSQAIINLGIIFFSLDVIVRYIGFIQDYWGYLGGAIVSIIGGVILIAGGLLIERWRRSLMAKVQE